jgi:Uncharacterized protein conserved in bacteria (DUF2313).
MIERISPIYAKSEIEQAIYQAIGTEWDSSYDLVDEILLQLFPQTATWGLAFWEQRNNLPTNLNEAIEIRRRKVIAKMQTRHPITPERMANILSSYTGVNTVITEAIADYTFGVTLVSKEYFNVNINEVISEIKRIKSSHLAYLLGLETQKTIKVTATRTYAFNPLNMCGQFNCGDGIVISNYGRSFASTLASHVDYSKNIKDYALGGTILSGLSSEFESGIATIGRVYSANGNIKPIRDYLYDSQLSKTDGYVIGSLYAALIQVASSYNNAMNTYDEAGNDLAGQFITGSNETFDTTIGKAYSSTIQENSDENNFVKEYNQAGDILTSTEVVV